tara:strand:- start:2726 stop:3550 length:825 start_codon:yes stop_codon:yes gene_type:complete
MEEQYLSLLGRILDDGDVRETRNGRVHSIFGASLSCDLAHGFPLLTTKKMFFRGIVEELAWFLRGSTNVQELRDRRVHIWDGNTRDRQYDAGPVYGFQWRHSGAAYTDCHQDYSGQGVDQVAAVLDLLTTSPHSRRILLNAWSPGQQSQMCLPPCHVMYQFYVRDQKLSCIMTQRSCDVFLGLPFNIASTALLVHLLAHQTGLAVGRLTLQLGDAHIYAEHVDVVQQQRTRTPRTLPTIRLDRPRHDGLWQVGPQDITVQDYQPHGRLVAEMKA